MAASTAGGSRDYDAPANVTNWMDCGMGIVVVLILLGGGVIGSTLFVENEAGRTVAIHAALMIAAWGALLPLGGIVARYFKVTPKQRFPDELDNLFWWRWHQRLQYGGIGLATLGFGTILSETGGRFATLHGWCGIAVMSLGWLQIFSTLFRGHKGGPTDRRADPADPATWRGDHYDMTRRRLLFEAWHKRAGWVVIAGAGVTILLGIALVGAPTWLIGVVAGLQSACVLAILDSSQRGRWVDTYVAIWGPDPIHPGNAVVRHGQSSRFKRAPPLDHTPDRSLS